MPKELWVTSVLYEKAERGDADSVKELCGIAARELRCSGSIPRAELAEFVASRLEQIAAGVMPQKAFFPKLAHRPKANNGLRDWEVKNEVQTLMKGGKSWTNACRLAAHESGGEVGLSVKSIEKICKDLKADTDLPLTDDIFPLGRAVIDGPEK